MQLQSTLARAGGVSVVTRGAEDIVLDVQARHGQALFGYARRLGLTDDQAADAVQEALVRLWRELLRDPAVMHPPAWTFRALHHLAMD
jgi:DNA-directed RNA polymerase specialized sigma24 family protein